MNQEAESTQVTAAVIDRWWQEHSAGHPDYDGVVRHSTDESCPFCRNKLMADAYAHAVAALPQRLAERAVKLKREAERLGAELTEVKRKLEAVLLKLPLAFAEARVDRLVYDGIRVQTRRYIWASKREEADKTAYLAALRAAGMDHCVVETYVHQSVQAHARELERMAREEEDAIDGIEALREKLGPELASMMNLSEQYKGELVRERPDKEKEGVDG